MEGLDKQDIAHPGDGWRREGLAASLGHVVVDRAAEEEGRGKVSALAVARFLQRSRLSHRLAVMLNL